MAGYAELMRKKSADELIRKGGDVITRSANTMLNLINDMLDIFKFEANQMKIVKEMVRLDECVENTLTLMMPLLQNASLRVAPQIASLAPLPADPVRIGQVIDNLIANAVKFSPRGGTIVVSLDRVQHNSSFFQEFAVSDEGPGISPDKQEQIFNKYAQLQQQKGPVPRGTGLGLAVSRLIVEAHGGVIGYKPGNKLGSIFYFRLPEWREGDTA
jgi:signal transduction histidine kinase